MAVMDGVLLLVERAAETRVVTHHADKITNDYRIHRPIQSPDAPVKTASIMSVHRHQTGQGPTEDAGQTHIKYRNCTVPPPPFVGRVSALARIVTPHTSLWCSIHTAQV